MNSQKNYLLDLNSLNDNQYHSTENQSFNIDDNNNNIPLKTDTPSDGSMFTKIFFLFAGLISILPYFIMIAETDNFVVLFEGMDFNFYIILPQYLAIPSMYVISKMLFSFQLKTKMKILIILEVFTFFSVYLIAVLTKPSVFTFWAILLTYSLTYVIANLLTGYFVCLCTKYTPDHMVVFYFCQPGVNCIVNALKVSFLWLEIDFFGDLSTIWALFFFLMLVVFIGVFIFEEKQEFKQVQSALFAKETIKSDQQYETSQTSEIVKKIWIELLSVFFGYFFVFVIFPGILFDIGPTAIMTLKSYIIWCNVSKSVLGVIGRLVAINKFARKYLKSWFFIMAPISIFIVIFYLNDSHNQYQVISASMIGLIGILIGIQGIICSSAAVLAGEKVQDEEREKVGILITYCTIIGTVLGNMSSFGLKYIKFNL